MSGRVHMPEHAQQRLAVSRENSRGERAANQNLDTASATTVGFLYLARLLLLSLTAHEHANSCSHTTRFHARTYNALSSCRRHRSGVPKRQMAIFSQ